MAHDHAGGSSAPGIPGGDGHAHGPRIGSAGGRHQKPLAIAFALTAAYALVEVVGGVVTGSLALISDAAHMGTDVLGLGLALAAIKLAKRPAAGQRTYGTYRLEVLAAVINGLLLFGVAFYVLYEAVQRFRDPPEVLGVPMLVVAVVGLLVNVVSFRLLTAGAKESLNVKGAYLEVLSDMLGSVGVIIGAVVITVTGFRYIDAIVAAAIGLFILPRTWQLMRQALRILMEVAPPGVDVEAAARELAAVPGVREVHDLHIWTLTSGMEAATAHVVIGDGADWHAVLDRTRQILAEGYGVTHPTIQIEPAEHVEEPAGF
ncbi:cation diffusion facilitator family transporter [Streptomyces sp. ActVer]|uniref:cation diffusion facilitator family transporter n=1 Tax=Streptomyces sp. ActVer TaxID=3014558 RepID=UPI0022B33487|nr:cation diffusion facilitator family transporter [Streptomyces sp. ActVer]MCZ4513697.1 cation diffusion facilitator family transporter [Streptomyces sp. ActVer]